MDDSEIDALALATGTEYFEEGSDIIKEGDKGDMFYLIEEGSVAVTKESLGDTPICTLKEGDFFGEKALLSDDIRTATCTASSKVRCLILVRQDFVRVLGNLKEILDTYTERQLALQRQQACRRTSQALEKIKSYRSK